VRHLENAGYVVMKKPAAGRGTADRRKRRVAFEPCAARGRPPSKSDR
jgi:hypothetical protein